MFGGYWEEEQEQEDVEQDDVKEVYVEVVDLRLRKRRAPVLMIWETPIRSSIASATAILQVPDLGLVSAQNLGMRLIGISGSMAYLFFFFFF